MPDLAAFRARLDASAIDRAPLRRAGLLTLLLVGLLVLTQTLRPEVRPASEMLARQDVQAEAERVSASGGLSAGTLTAVALLVLGGGAALWLRRRPSASGAEPEHAIEVLETHTLGPNHSLRLVACGDAVLLLDVGAEGARLLREWPRTAFEAAPASVPALASVEVAAPEAGAATSPLHRGEGQGERSRLGAGRGGRFDAPLPASPR
ncbi:MAG: flagellar biosynthetic protein FliO, partial [Bacteroidota bacterium]